MRKYFVVKSNATSKPVKKKQSEHYSFNKPKKREYVTGDFRDYRPKKFAGNLEKPIKYRSSYELRYMQGLEYNPKVKAWNYENIKIPYVIKELNPKTNKVEIVRHIYIMDFEVTMQNGFKLLVEIKPDSKSPKTLKQIKENFDVYKNANKWKAAENYAKVHGYVFQVLTEKDLF